jgi:hypothetical protein
MQASAIVGIDDSEPEQLRLSTPYSEVLRIDEHAGRFSTTCAMRIDDGIREIPALSHVASRSSPVTATGRTLDHRPPPTLTNCNCLQNRRGEHVSRRNQFEEFSPR